MMIPPSDPDTRAIDPRPDPYADARDHEQRHLLSIAETAQLLGISPSHCDDLFNRGELPVPGIKLGARKFTKRIELEAWLGISQSPEPARLAVVPPQPTTERDLALAACDRRIAELDTEVARERALRTLIADVAIADRRVS